MSKVTPTITTGVSVTTFMFLFTYLPQAAVLALVNGPLAVVSAIPLVLSESSAVTNLLARSFFIEDALIDTFDAVSGRNAPFHACVLIVIDSDITQHDWYCHRRPSNQIWGRSRGEAGEDAEETVHTIYSQGNHSILHVHATQFHSGCRHCDVCRSSGEEIWSNCTREVLPAQEDVGIAEAGVYRAAASCVHEVRWSLCTSQVSC